VRHTVISTFPFHHHHPRAHSIPSHASPALFHPVASVLNLLVLALRGLAALALPGLLGAPCGTNSEADIDLAAVDTDADVRDATLKNRGRRLGGCSGVLGGEPLAAHDACVHRAAPPSPHTNANRSSSRRSGFTHLCLFGLGCFCPHSLSREQYCDVH
jgi:hypothetical protein